jgi:hypothetical protein
MRDPNVRMLMGSLGAESPMFDYVEQMCGRATPAGGSNLSNKQSREKQELD